MKRLSGLVLSLFLWWCVAPLAAETVQLTPEGNCFSVPVTINGAMVLHFVVDTGADGVTIPAEVLLTLLHTKTIDEAELKLGENEYVLADGSKVKYQKVRLKSVQLGSVVAEDLEAAVGPPGSSLLLGQSFLKRLGKWSMDSSSAQLTFEGVSPVQSYNDQGLKLHQEDRCAEAVKAFTQALKMNYNDPILLYNRAGCYNELAQYPLALQDITKACHLDPKDADLFFRKGDIEDNMEKYDEALKSYNTSIRLNRNAASSWAYRGYTYYKLSNTDLAWKDFTQAIELDSANYMARRWRGQQYLDAEDYESAIADFSAVLAASPDDVSCLELRGSCYFIKGQQAQALTDLSRWVAQEPNSGRSHGWRALVLFEMGDFAGALSDLNEAVKLEPDVYWIRFQRGRTHERLASKTEALADYREAARLAPDAKKKKDAEEKIRSLSK